MVYSCVRTHGEIVRLVSSVGVGTTFQILLPVVEEPGDADEPRAPETEIPRGTETVLVVDDEEIPLNLLCDVLRSLGYASLPAASGEEGIEILRYAPEKVDLVIVNRIMPGWTASNPSRGSASSVRPSGRSSAPGPPKRRERPPVPFRTGSTISSRSRTSGRRWPARCDPFSTQGCQKIDGLRGVLTPPPASPSFLEIKTV